jgi:hypothetical protein
MAKKRKAAKKKTVKRKSAKRSTGKRAKIKCPMCKCTNSVSMPNKGCTQTCKCPGCKETIEADKCCILCDYAQKPCGGCKKKKK